LKLFEALAHFFSFSTSKGASFTAGPLSGSECG